jgi:DNA repair exonuclease SbcCD nuclease subunit
MSKYLHFLAASDFHVGGMLKVLVDPLKWQIREINKVYQYALANSIKHLFVPGDLSHTPTLTYEELVALLTLLLTYDGSINTYYSLGNHDVESVKKSSMDLLKVLADSGFFKTFKVYKQPEVVKIDGVNVAFLPFPHLKVPESSKPPLVFAHIDTEGAIGDNGRPLKGGHDSELIRQPGDYIISGHLHKHQLLKKKRILYVGSLYQTNFGESFPKGFLECKAKYVDGKLKVKYEQINNNQDFILDTKIISSNEDWDSLDLSQHVRYKVLIDEGLVVPKHVTDKIRNIVSIAALSKKSKVQMEEIINKTHSIPVSHNIKITSGLSEYLKKSDLDPANIKKARALAKEAAHSLGLL